MKHRLFFVFLVVLSFGLGFKPGAAVANSTGNPPYTLQDVVVLEHNVVIPHWLCWDNDISTSLFLNSVYPFQCCGSFSLGCADWEWEVIRRACGVAHEGQMNAKDSQGNLIYSIWPAREVSVDCNCFGVVSNCYTVYTGGVYYDFACGPCPT